jgi:hypothetical protein
MVASSIGFPFLLLNVGYRCVSNWFWLCRRFENIDGRPPGFFSLGELWGALRFRLLIPCL